MTFRRSMVLCVSLASAVAVVGCAGLHEQSASSGVRDADTPPVKSWYEGTTYYNAVRIDGSGWVTIQPNSQVDESAGAGAVWW